MSPAAFWLVICSLCVTPPYDRGAFHHWVDLDGDCQDARAEALISAAEDYKLSRDGCRVLAVRLIDPYTGKTYSGASSLLDVDHVVPLAEAWRSGAWRWTAEMRERFANDPDNLEPTSRHENRSKGDGDLSEWLPLANRCAYVDRYLEVKGKYRLSMDGAEVKALATEVSRCLGFTSTEITGKLPISQENPQ